MTARSGQKRNSIAVAYQAIRDLIVEGRLAPGARLVERDLAKHIGLSRSPVRAAVLCLQQEGFALAGQGERSRVVVAPLTKADAGELYSLIGFLDGEAASKAAALPDTLRGQLVERLRSVTAELDGVARQVPFDSRRFFDLDAAFHDAYQQMAQTPRLLALYRSTRPQADRYNLFYNSGTHVSSLVNVIDEHGAIVDAIEGGHALRAAHSAQLNWQHAAERVSTIMNVTGEFGKL